MQVRSLVFCCNENHPLPPELKAKTFWEIIVGVCFQYSRQSLDKQIQLLQKGEVV